MIRYLNSVIPFLLQKPVHLLLLKLCIVLCRPLELYDIKADPAEKTDMALERKDIVAKIDTYLQTARTESETWPLKAPKAAPSETPKKN